MPAPKAGKKPKSIDDTITKLRDAADQLQAAKGEAPEVQKQVLETLSCCGDCTGISAIPPCAGACIKVSPLL